MRRAALLALAFAVGCGGAASQKATSGGAGWLKGQLHVHTSNSGDSHTPPDEVARWYAAHGFDFLVFTDHSFVTVVTAPGILTLPGVEITQNRETCTDPPPEAADLGCLIHVNALATDDRRSHEEAPPDERPARADAYAAAVAQAKQLGGIAQLNHPNFHWTANADAIAKSGAVLLEIANMGSDVNNDGDATHPSTEALWDAVLTRGATVFGTATDDAHVYRDAEIATLRAQGENPDVGDRGWVMVRAARDPGAIRAALARGEFYASTGVVLRAVERVGDTLVVEAADDVDVTFIGTGGKVVGAVHGKRAVSPPIAKGGYVRADVVDARGKRAWVQPIR